MNATQKRWLLGIVLIAILLRLGAIWFLHDRIKYNTFEFGRIAQNIVAGKGFSYDYYRTYPIAPTAFMAPLYCYLLALYYWVFGTNLIGFAVIQAFIGGGACWLFGRVGFMLYGATAGLIAAAIFAFYPEMIFLSQKIVPEGLQIVWILLIVLFGAKYLKQGRKRDIIISGILLGLAILTRESAMVYPICLLGWFWVRAKRTRRLLVDSLLLLLVTTVTVAPWTARNYLVFDQFIPVRSNFWINVWRGNNPDATGTARGEDKQPIDRSVNSAYMEELQARLTSNEIQREKVYKDYAIRYIRENPIRYAELSVRRLIYFWTVDPTHPLSTNPLYWIPWSILLILVGYGVVKARRVWQSYSFWLLQGLAYTVVYSLTLVLPRYRIPLYPALFLLAAVGMEYLYNRLNSKRV